MKSTGIVIYLVVLFNCSLLAQSKIYGTVKDIDTKQPLEFATVVISNSEYGVYTNRAGEFEIGYSDNTLLDSISISSIGYGKLIVAIDKNKFDSLKIELVPSTTNLQEVFVKSEYIKRYRKMEMGIGKRKTNNSFSSRVHSTYEFAVFIPNEKNNNGFFKSIELYITQFDFNDDPFRLNLYKLDTNCNCPGESLLKRSQYLDKAKKGWNSISIDNQYIEIPFAGFFISYERLSFISNPQIEVQHHSIGWIKNMGTKIHRVFTRVGGNSWNSNNRFTRSGNIPLLRSKVKAY